MPPSRTVSQRAEVGLEVQLLSENRSKSARLPRFARMDWVIKSTSRAC
jgi:hypothetical protein